MSAPPPAPLDADDDIGLVHKDLPSLHIADEIEGRLFQALKGLFRDFVALGIFFADAQQTNSGMGLVQHMLRVFVSHQGELR